MMYWGFLIFLLVLLALVISALIYYIKKVIDRREEGDDIDAIKFFACVVVLLIGFTIFHAVDIPSALSGGEMMCVDELPRRIGSGRIKQFITDNPELKELTGYDPNNYEQYGHYHIRYTKIHKFVLDIEKID